MKHPVPAPHSTEWAKHSDTAPESLTTHEAERWPVGDVAAEVAALIAVTHI
eukprot:CAMPEP_0172003526 /NCGR_PEP_ID=MMETSP1041-20130122/3986_1 /TAXON_ID=464988 /ORGANISM="Hemiselmis andersenii, Strain CCMP439" /LENGTH=50 /DNA_ID=CAMNT_0012657311 /DNA_START=329 /DNA_END=478 /DNA_ORIENTATION=-